MGDRVAVAFRTRSRDEWTKKTGTETSVALYSQWDGVDLVARAEKLALDVIAATEPGSIVRPISRFEPDVMMVEFIRRETTRNYAGGPAGFDANSALRLGPDLDYFESMADDNGCWLIIIDAKKRAISRKQATKGEFQPDNLRALLTQARKDAGCI